jgi:hypothetical protein
MSGLPMLVEPSETSLLGALAPLVARQPALVLGAGPGPVVSVHRQRGLNYAAAAALAKTSTIRL